jgi:hypothetical protein
MSVYQMPTETANVKVPGATFVENDNDNSFISKSLQSPFVRDSHVEIGFALQQCVRGEKIVL